MKPRQNLNLQNAFGLEIMAISETWLGDNLQYMSKFPDKFFDLACADPNYGIGEDGRKTRSRTFRKDGTARLSIDSRNGKKALIFNEYTPKNWDNNSPDEKYFIELARVSKNQIIFGANHFISKIPFDSSCWIVWDKINGGNDFADCEMAWTSFKSAARLFRFMWNGMLRGSEESGELMEGNTAKRGKRIHPTEKPIALYKWILNNYAKKGDKILDPNLGSQSSRIAAYDLGFDFYGAELDLDYFTDGNARFEKHKLKCEEIRKLGFAKTQISETNPTLF